MNDRETTVPSDSRTDADPDRRLRRLVDSLDDAVYELDASGRFVMVSDAVVELTGYDRETLLGEHVSFALDDRDVERFETEIRSRLQSGTDPDTTYQLAVETASGDPVPCELRFSLLTAGGSFEGTAGVLRPVGGRDDSVDGRGGSTDAMASIWETYESISSVIDEADVGVFVLDDSFDVVWIDETVEEYFGVDREAVVGRDKRTLIEETIADRFADPDAFAETVVATYDDNSYVEQFECRITEGPGRKSRWLEHRSRPIESGRYAGGRIELYYDVSDRKASERARAESERRFRSLVDAVEEYAIFRLDPDGRVASWNEGAERIKGYDTSEIVGEHVSTFYTEEDRAAGVPEEILERARTEGSVEDEGWRVNADGSRFWASVTITAIRDEGDLRGFAKVTRDMTDQRERERRLQRERDLVEQILETSPVGIAVVEADGSTNRANERMAALLDVPPDEISAYEAGDRTMYDGAGEPIPVSERPASRVFETGEPVSDREVLVDPDGGRRRWLSINATPIAEGADQPGRVVVTATDVTDLKELAERRKQELEEREKELAAVELAANVLETDDDPIENALETFVTNLPRSFQYPDRTDACVAVGDHEVSTEGFERRDSRITARSRTDSGTPVEIVVAIDPASSSEAQRFLEAESDLIETLATLLTVHFERREYIDQLQAETRRLEQFAYAASHDLQEPLRMISSYLQLIDRRYGDDLDDDGREFLEFAVDGAERMREMVDGLLEYSRVETRGDPLASVDLEAVLDDVLTDLQVRIAETDATVTADPLPTVEGDASQLRQVFQNLLDNAIEYSEDDPRVHVTADRRGDEWLLSVSDEGIGIEADEADRVFAVFERLHGHEDHPGTGIGLALCRRIVDRHGGEIWIDSNSGEGTTVSFTLPAADDADG